MRTFIAVLACIVSLSAQSEDFEVRIAEDLPYVDVLHEGKTVRIQRIQDQENVISGGFEKTSRKCPPFCIHPMEVAPGVSTIGEIELLTFIKNEVAQGTGLVIDARTPSWYQKGTIPGSINIPFTDFAEESYSDKLRSLMERLGAKPKSADTSLVDELIAWYHEVAGDADASTSSEWDFTQAKKLAIWCNGPWCDQSPRAIRSLLALGYPAEKIHYYRGGMQLWQIFGLTVVTP